jgi:hypothetical protein
MLDGRCEGVGPSEDTGTSSLWIEEDSRQEELAEYLENWRIRDWGQKAEDKGISNIGP